MKKWTLILPPVIILVILIVLLLALDPSGSSLKALLIAPLSKPFLIGRTLNLAFLLILPALGIAIAFRSGVYNLGGEGQIYMGGLVCLLIHLALPHWPSALIWLIAWGAATITGGLMTALSAWLKVRLSIQELLSTYLLSLGLSKIVDGIITGPLQDPDSYLMTTALISEHQRLTSWLPSTPLNGGLVISLLALVLVYLFFHRRWEGFYWDLTGKNPLLAQYTGANPSKISMKALIISGMLHGLTGALFISGNSFAGYPGFSGGLGWDGMAVALMGELHPLFILPSSVFYALLRQGSDHAYLMGYLGLNPKGFILALVFFLSTSRILVLSRRKRRDI
ncbi:MAG: ABC transporter permease [Spirochaetaceae bacterium]|nr:ABC transporter permease [Spirochaetaceae bacterium]